MGSEGEMPTTSRAHVLVIPYPSQPHILPTLDLARQIASRGDVTVTFLSFKTLIDRLVGNEELLSASGAAIDFVGVRDDDPGHDFPSELPHDPIVLRESLLLGFNMEPFVDKLLRDRESAGFQGPTCMLVDMIHWWSIEVAAKLNIPRYVLGVIAAARVAAFLSWHKHGIEELPGGGIRLTGLPPDLVTEYRHLPACRKGNKLGKQVITRFPRSMLESDGVLLNTWTALDSPILDSIRDMLPQNMPLLAVGPLGTFPSVGSKNVSLEGLVLSGDEEATNWLNQQPPLSVLLVSFGTTGLNNLAKRHVVELAKGLERSQQRFVWILRAPPDVPDIDDCLPAGFRERTKDRGLLLEGWAPQKLILSHPSTGGFLSSCGWNSAVESVSRGVPIIGWPSFADQPAVSRCLAVLSKVGIELPQQEGFFVQADDIADAINVVLQTAEGREMRKRAAECKASVAAALASGGSSMRAVQDFYELIKSGPGKSR